MSRENFEDFVKRDLVRAVVERTRPSDPKLAWI